VHTKDRNPKESFKIKLEAKHAYIIPFECGSTFPPFEQDFYNSSNLQSSGSLAEDTGARRNFIAMYPVDSSFGNAAAGRLFPIEWTPILLDPTPPDIEIYLSQVHSLFIHLVNRAQTRRSQDSRTDYPTRYS
jgi:hypothetical protein